MPRFMRLLAASLALLTLILPCTAALAGPPVTRAVHLYLPLIVRTAAPSG